MADGIIISESEYNRFKRMLSDYERNAGVGVQVRRRRGIMGGFELITAIVVRDLKRDNPDRLFPTDCTWGTPDDPWELEDQKFYVVRLANDTTEVYDSGGSYIPGDYCIFEVLADSVTDEDFAEIGYGYQLKYKCTGDTSGPFAASKWELVNAYTEGQWKIKRPVNESAIVDMRNYQPWFELDDLLPIIEIDTIYLFWQTFIHTGSGSSSSITWNEKDGRAMAVFK